MTTPRAGRSVRGSKTGRPIMVLLDLLGRRWTLRMLWELRTGPQSFRTLQERCGDISPTILNRRLAEMRETGIVEHRQNEGYALTDEGIELLTSLAPLNEWARKWAQHMEKRTC